MRIEGTEGVEELFVGGFHVEGLAGIRLVVALVAHCVVMCCVV